MSSKHEVPAPQPTPCPECHGERVVAEALNNIRLTRPGTALPGLTGLTTELWALTCVSCGHTVLYAKDPHLLLPKT